MKSIALVYLMVINVAVFGMSALTVLNKQNDPILSSVAEYEPHSVYVQLKEGYTIGTSDIFNSEDDGLSLFPELQSMMAIGQIARISQEFKFLAKRSDELARVYRIELNDLISIDEFVGDISKLYYINFSEKIPLYKTELVPNDPDYLVPSKKWHLQQIGAESAWDITSGCSSIKIAVVDDAVRLQHEDLNPNIFVNALEIPNNGLDDDNNGYIDDVSGFDLADNDNDASPPATATNSFFTHGTHVAGIAAASTNNGLGNASIGFNSSIIPIKVKSDLNTSTSTLDNPFLGVEYAIAIGADVVNMSWGSYGYSAIHQMVISQAYSNGIVLVGAAGNSSIQAIAYPAGYQHVISVCATNNLNGVASFSNYSPEADIYAPGENIWSCLAGSNDAYGFLSGTSMSSPLVAGAAALMLCNNPIMTPFEVENCIRVSGDLYPYSSGVGTFSILNVPQSLTCIPPVVNNCQPTTCELISNGSFEIPDNSNITDYGWASGIANDFVCSWQAYWATTDIYPSDVYASNHYTQGACMDDGYTEGVVSNQLALIPGKSYVLEFDYCVSRTDGAPADLLDSIIIGLVEPGFVYSLGDPMNFDTLHLGALTNLGTDYNVSLAWGEWIDGTFVFENYSHHFTFQFTAPSGTENYRLLIHPINNDPSWEVTNLLLDNISLRPYSALNVSASQTTILSGECVNLIVTGTEDTYIWEPLDEFSNAIGTNQMVCPDSTITYSVSAIDTNGCSSSDSITIQVINQNNILTNDGNSISVYPNPTVENLSIDATDLSEFKIAQLMTATGDIIFEAQIQPGQINVIELSNFSAGIYYCQVQDFGVFIITKL